MTYMTEIQESINTIFQKYSDIFNKHPRLTNAGYLVPRLVRCSAKLFSSSNADADLRKARDTGQENFYWNPEKAAIELYAKGNGAQVLRDFFGDTFVHADILNTNPTKIAKDVVAACLFKTIDMTLSGLGISEHREKIAQYSIEVANRTACECAKNPHLCYGMDELQGTSPVVCGETSPCDENPNSYSSRV